MDHSYRQEFQEVKFRQIKLMEIITPLTGKFSSYVKNSAHVKEKIANALFHFNQMVSLDVVNLFTKAPTNDTQGVSSWCNG